MSKKNFVPLLNLPSPDQEPPDPLAMNTPSLPSLHFIDPLVVASIAGMKIYPLQTTPLMFRISMAALLPTPPLADPLNTSSPAIFIVAGTVPHEDTNRAPNKIVICFMLDLGHDRHSLSSPSLSLGDTCLYRMTIHFVVGRYRMPVSMCSGSSVT